MAIPANTVWEVRQDGDDTNGGGWVTTGTGTDWTQQAAAQYSVTDGVTNGTTTITSASANFGVDVVGNIMYVEGGTGAVTAGWYHITARTNSTTITVDRSTGLTAGTGVTLKIGGALASPARATGSKAAGNDVFIKYSATDYLMTTTSTNVAGGRINDTTGGVDQGQSFYIGYDSDRSIFNTDANRPTIKVSGISSTTMITAGALGLTFMNIIVDGDSQTSITGFNITEAFGGCRAINCKAENCTNSGFVGDGLGADAIFCEATGCSSQPAFLWGTSQGGMLLYCYAHDNTVTGIQTAAKHTVVGCISESNSGASSDGFVDGSTAYGQFINCVAFNNGRDGFGVSITFGRNQECINCISWDNTRYGFACSASGSNFFLLNCAYGSNGTADTILVNVNAGGITLTADPFTDSANGDFTLNNTSGGGAELRNVGYPATFNGFDTYLDIGALQSEDSVSAATTTAHTF